MKHVGWEGNRVGWGVVSVFFVGPDHNILHLSGKEKERKITERGAKKERRRNTRAPHVEEKRVDNNGYRERTYK